MKFEEASKALVIFIGLSLIAFVVTRAFSSAADITSKVRSTNVNDLKFKLSQRVSINVKFYSECEGQIVDFNPYYTVGRGPSYKLDLYCPGIGWLKESVQLLESDLALVKSDDP